MRKEDRLITVIGVLTALMGVLMLSDGRQNLIYKHAISTIQPAEQLRRPGADGGTGAE